MSMPDDELLDLNALCSALVDRTIDRAGRERLARMLETSEDARRFYVRAMALSASLHDYAGELQSEEPATRGRLGRIVQMPVARWALGTLAAAATVALAFWIGNLRSRTPIGATAETSEDDTFVATLSATENCRWAGANPALGEELQQGRQLVLEAGRAELNFDSGAQVVIDGPATIELVSAWEAVLRRGALRASVPPEAIGFRISNSDVEVIDLGTEFGMVAGEHGGTEVFVLDGAVQARPGEPGEAITLHQHQARRFARSGVTEVRDREQKVKRWAAKSRLAQIARPANYVHWTFDELDGATLHGQRTGQLGTAPLEARLGRDRGFLTAGWRGKGLELTGPASVELPTASSGRAAKTIAFWLRVPREAALTAAGPMVRFADEPNAEVSWNRDPTRGVLGALLARTEKGLFHGTTSLRDGQWHHVGIVLGQNGRARQYLDGRLESTAAKRRGRRGDREPILDPGIRGIGGVLLGGSGATGEAFRGTIDEVFVADRALTSTELRHLLRDNAPNSEPTLASQ